MPAEPLPRSPRHGFFDQEIGWITSTGKLFGASRGARLARGDLAAVTVTSHRRILDRLWRPRLGCFQALAETVVGQVSRLAPDRIYDSVGERAHEP